MEPFSTSPTPPTPPASPTKDERLWATVCHLAAFAGVPFPILGSVIGPLIVWLIKRQDSPFVDDQGKESLNFQITMTIGILICIPLVFILIGVPLIVLLGLTDIILTIIASIKANDGETYRYPFAIRLIQ